MRTTCPRNHLPGLAGLLCLGWPLVVVMSVAYGKTPGEGGRISQHIAYSFLLRNSTNRVVEQVEFWTYALVTRTATQQCTELSSSQPFEIVTDAIGNQILHFTLSKLPPFR